MSDPAGSGQQNPNQQPTNVQTKNSRREGIPLGRIAGIPIVLAYSWFIIAAFTVIAYGPVLQHGTPSLGIGAYYVAFAYAVLLLLSVLVHELAHALTAKIYGWPSEKIVLNLWAATPSLRASPPPQDGPCWWPWPGPPPTSCWPARPGW